MKFIASYSGGKDSILAIYRAIKEGMEPIALIITCENEGERSWFHGISYSILEKVEKSLGIPIWCIETTAENYEENFQKALLRGKQLGAQVCVFGDIDLEEHYDWCSKRCESVGIKANFPLWKEERKNVVNEFINSGFIAYVTVVDTTRMSDRFLGKVLNKEIIHLIEGEGADVCGENGEYHTFVCDGPIFNEKINVKFENKVIKNGYASIAMC